MGAVGTECPNHHIWCSLVTIPADSHHMSCCNGEVITAASFVERKLFGRVSVRNPAVLANPQVSGSRPCEVASMGEPNPPRLAADATPQRGSALSIPRQSRSHRRQSARLAHTIRRSQRRGHPTCYVRDFPGSRAWCASPAVRVLGDRTVDVERRGAVHRPLLEFGVEIGSARPCNDLGGNPLWGARGRTVCISPQFVWSLLWTTSEGLWTKGCSSSAKLPPSGP
jgi:hypothetical protein